jgi:hypothetical protein
MADHSKNRTWICPDFELQIQFLDHYCILMPIVPEANNVSSFEKEVVVAHVISMAMSANHKVNVILQHNYKQLTKLKYEKNRLKVPKSSNLKRLVYRLVAKLEVPKK